MFDYLLKKYQHFARKVYMAGKSLRLKNMDFSLVSSNCNGGDILHDLKVPFRSPFAGLSCSPEDYLKLLGNLRGYMQCRLEFFKEEGISYPLARLNDITIHFVHYQSEEEAAQKWKRRAARMNYDNLFILFSDRGACTEEHLKQFDSLPYKNKAVFVNHPREDLSSAVYIRGFEELSSVGICLYYKSRYSCKKHYDQFDYVKWFNTGSIR